VRGHLSGHGASPDAARPGQRIKTDRRDATKLVRLFRAAELTPVHVPNEAEEAVRDLLGCREDVRRDVLRWRHRLASG
jgi:transposase